MNVSPNSESVGCDPMLKFDIENELLLCVQSWRRDASAAGQRRDRTTLDFLHRRQCRHIRKLLGHRRLLSRSLPPPKIEINEHFFKYYFYLLKMKIDGIDFF